MGLWWGRRTYRTVHSAPEKVEVRDAHGSRRAPIKEGNTPRKGDLFWVVWLIAYWYHLSGGFNRQRALGLEGYSEETHLS